MFVHNIVDDVWEFYQILSEIEGKPAMFVLVALNCKPIMEQQSAVGVMSVAEIDLIVGLEAI